MTTKFWPTTMRSCSGRKVDPLLLRNDLVQDALKSFITFGEMQ
jgi:hypothetical protein